MQSTNDSILYFIQLFFTFFMLVEIGGMWKQLVFPGNISTSIYCE